MRRLRIWWWGLQALALAAVAVWAAVTNGWIEPLWAPGPADREARAPDAARPGGGTVRPTPEPLMFRAARDGDRLILSGAVAPGESRSALLDAARGTASGTAVTDELKISDQAAPQFQEAAVFAVRQLAQLPSGTVTVRDNMITVVGTAPDVQAYNAIARGPQPPAGFHLDVAGLLPPAARPYTWSATSSENGIALAGHAPSERARQELLALARSAFPHKQVAERLQPASGLSPSIDFNSATLFALTRLAQLRTGTVEIVDARLNVMGDVTDRETLASVREALQAGLPPGLQPGTVAIILTKPSPYAFRAVRQAGTLTMTGYYPDQESRTAIHALIRERFFGEQVVDRLRAAEGAPKEYLRGVSYGLEHLARLATGELTVNGTALRLSGEALYEQTAEQSARAVPALPLRGWTGVAEIRTRPPEKADAAELPGRLP